MFIGHKKQLNFLINSLKNNKLSQVYLFSGPESVGKFTLAKMLSLTLIDETVEIDKNYFLAQAENKNPDIQILAPRVIEKKGITKSKDIQVEDIREAQKNLTLFPSKGKYRILIINDAHRLTSAAQNALLKNLEEPVSSVIIILVTNAEGRILKTIKSRCQKINFNLVALEDIKLGFRNQIAAESLDKLVIFSMGKPGEIKRLNEKIDNFKERELAMKELGELGKLPLFQRMDLAQEWSKNVGKTRKKIEFWIWIMRLQTFKNLNNPNLVRNNYLIIGKMEDVLLKLKNASFNSRLILENLFLSF